MVVERAPPKNPTEGFSPFFRLSPPWPFTQPHSTSTDKAFTTCSFPTHHHRSSSGSLCRLAVYHKRSKVALPWVAQKNPLFPSYMIVLARVPHRSTYRSNDQKQKHNPAAL